MEIKYNWQPAKNAKLPILISVPHAGTAVPQDLQERMQPAFRQAPPDTDWFVDRLYEFAPAVGISVISSHYSRYVVDLNRPDDGHALYADGRSETGLMPLRSFAGEPLYVPGKEPTAEERVQRLGAYYRPYHQRLQEELQQLKDEFGVALLWDGHSIKSEVPSLHPERFVDLILGNQDGKTAGESLIKLVTQRLEKSAYSFSHNHPFKGGYITRRFGRPEQNIHALQLEMSQRIYMDEKTGVYQPEKAAPLQGLLQATLLELAQAVLEHS